MKYGIVVDSSCDIRDIKDFNNRQGNNYEEDKYSFFSVPLKLEIGEKEFVDDKSLDVSAFMEEALSYKGKTGSAAPGPGEWLEAFEAAEMIFAFTITSNLSGSYNSAQTAQRMALEKNPEKKIFLMDTLSIGPETSLLVRKTIECIDRGMNFEAAAQTLVEYSKKTKLLFILEHMDNLVHNGRVSKLQGSLAGLLGIKILGRASDDGRLDLLHKLRGKYNVYNKCVEEMISRGFQGGRVIIAYCLTSEKAEYLRDRLLEKYPQSHITLMQAGGLCTYYAEKNGMIIGYETGIN